MVGRRHGTPAPRVRSRIAQRGFGQAFGCLAGRRQQLVRHAALFEQVDPIRAGQVRARLAGTDAAVNAAMLAVRPGARVLLLGIPDGDSTTFRASVARRKGLTIVLVRRMKEVYPRAIDLVRRGLVDVSSLVTARYPLERVADALTSAAAREGLKVVVT